MTDVFLGLIHWFQLFSQDDEDGPDSRRSKRSRKDVDYAKLNDFYLPPLGPQDFVGSREKVRGMAYPGDLSCGYGNSMPYGTRSSRRVRGIKPNEEDDPREDQSTGLTLRPAHSWYEGEDELTSEEEGGGEYGLNLPLSTASLYSSEDGYLPCAAVDDVTLSGESSLDETGSDVSLLVCLPRQRLPIPPKHTTREDGGRDSRDSWRTPNLYNHAQSTDAPMETAPVHQDCCEGKPPVRTSPAQ